LRILGYIFGSRENAPYFIAGIMVVLSLIGIFIILSTANKDNSSNGDMLKAFSAFIFAALSFIGGYSGRSRR
jgi:drug/metabolite transporter (DMT)-like permease